MGRWIKELKELKKILKSTGSQETRISAKSKRKKGVKIWKHCVPLSVGL